jgi:formylglycine-generating enzyme required for sulfatase activity
VTLNSKGGITSRRKGHARYYVEDINGVALEMVEIPSGSFTMGSPANEGGRSDNEGPQHHVTIPRFFMGKYEVTQAEWRAVAKLPNARGYLNPSPSHFIGDDRPVEQVSWDDAMEFCARLSKVTHRSYGLPSEAQWEYASRAGTTSEFAFGQTINAELVNYDGTRPYGSALIGVSRYRTAPVGSLGAANGFGLYDMHGNVDEWCSDHWHDSYHGAPGDGTSWAAEALTNTRVVRGGYFQLSGDECRAAKRFMHSPDYKYNGGGFRVAVALPR